MDSTKFKTEANKILIIVYLQVNAVDTGQCHQQYHHRQISVILRRAFLVKSQFLTVNYYPIYCSLKQI